MRHTLSAPFMRSSGSVMNRRLFHASSFQGFRSLRAGDVVTLRPGKQNAQGVGVYLSAGAPDVRASDSVHEAGLAVVFDLSVDTDKSWYASKNSADRKKGRPKTWHTQGRDLSVRIDSVQIVDGVRHLVGVGIAVSVGLLSFPTN